MKPETNVERIGDVMYYAGSVSLLPSACLAPQDMGEIEALMEVSSNWMKLFTASDSLSTNELRKILYIEICGRRREDMINRVRALIETRNRNRNIEEVMVMLLEVTTEEKERERASD